MPADTDTDCNTQPHTHFDAYDTAHTHTHAYRFGDQHYHPVSYEYAHPYADIDYPSIWRFHRSRGSGTPDQRIGMDRPQGGG
jgi:hypothetical protein